MSFLQPLSVQARHARKTHPSATLEHDRSALFRLGYSVSLMTQYLQDHAHQTLSILTQALELLTTY